MERNPQASSTCEAEGGASTVSTARKALAFISYRPIWGVAEATAASAAAEG